MYMYLYVQEGFLILDCSLLLLILFLFLIPLNLKGIHRLQFLVSASHGVSDKKVMGGTNETKLLKIKSLPSFAHLNTLLGINIFIRQINL